jgi:hypothetical protein
LQLLWRVSGERQRPSIHILAAHGHCSDLRRSEVLRETPVVEPALASWDAKAAPSQVRLNGYLSELIPALGPLPVGNDPLFLHFQIGVTDPATLLIGCDLENYLFPLFGTKLQHAAQSGQGHFRILARGSILQHGRAAAPTTLNTLLVTA